jgi:CrcB protein
LRIETILAVGVGGFIGANLRLYLNGVVNRNLHLFSLPLGTLFVNIIGSFLIGLLFSYFHTHEVSPIIKTLFVTGFLGALTTFSTFAYENLLFLQSGNFGGAVLNIGLNIFGTLMFAYFGLKLGRYFFGS